jgi:leucyl aminopeptidase
MNVSLAVQLPREIDADAVVVGWYSDTAAPAARNLGPALQEAVTRLIEAKEITGKSGEITTILAPAGMRAPRLVVLGLGDRSKLDRGGAFRATASAAKSLAARPLRRVAYFVSDGWTPDLVEAGLCGAMIGCVGQDLYRAEKKLSPFGELLWAGSEAESVQNAWILAEAVNLARKLVNQPASEIYPESFAAVAGPGGAGSGFGSRRVGRTAA